MRSQLAREWHTQPWVAEWVAREAPWEVRLQQELWRLEAAAAAHHARQNGAARR